MLYYGLILFFLLYGFYIIVFLGANLEKIQRKAEKKRLLGGTNRAIRNTSLLQTGIAR